MATTHFSGPLQGGGKTIVGSAGYETVTGAKTLTDKDDGKIFLLNAAAGAAIALPAHKAGLAFKFIIAANFATTDWQITGGATSISGSVQEAGAQQTFAGNSGLDFELAAETIGDWVELESDGTNWWITGMTVALTSITPT